MITGTYYKFKFFLKGQSNEIFDLRFFSSLEPVWATDQQIEIFFILVKNSPSYTNFKFENVTPRGIIPRRVSLPEVSYPSESVSPEYHTPAKQSPRVSYPGESISPGYHTPLSQFFRH